MLEDGYAVKCGKKAIPPRLIHRIRRGILAKIMNDFWYWMKAGSASKFNLEQEFFRMSSNFGSGEIDSYEVIPYIEINGSLQYVHTT